jgi:hypothetical protein
MGGESGILISSFLDEHCDTLYCQDGCAPHIYLSYVLWLNILNYSHVLASCLINLSFFFLLYVTQLHFSEQRCVRYCILEI